MLKIGPVAKFLAIQRYYVRSLDCDGIGVVAADFNPNSEVMSRDEQYLKAFLLYSGSDRMTSSGSEVGGRISGGSFPKLDSLQGPRSQNLQILEAGEPAQIPC